MHGNFVEDDMAAEKWVITECKHCDRIDQDVEIKEKRVIPTMDFLQMIDSGFRVRARTCSAAVFCNMAHIPCKLAYNQPEA
jgi:hypothetical protein